MLSGFGVVVYGQLAGIVTWGLWGMAGFAKAAKCMLVRLSLQLLLVLYKGAGLNGVGA